MSHSFWKIHVKWNAMDIKTQNPSTSIDLVKCLTVFIYTPSLEKFSIKSILAMYIIL